MNVEKTVRQLAREYEQYDPDAYFFVLSAVNYTVTALKREGHVSGGELLEGIREYALAEYGPMAYTLIEHWGVKTTEDFGRIVFALVDAELLGKTEGDSIEDFIDVFDLDTAFKKPFDPD